MKVTIFGSGYVGLVTGACLAEVGNDVVCVDIDERKIKMLNEGGIPIYEPGLDKLVTENAKAGRLSFTTDVAKGIDHGLFLFIAVGTPPDEDGSADLQYVLAVARDIGQYMKEYKVVIDKSTVPVGTADKVRAKMKEVLAQRGANFEFDVVSNPEFLKEGDAIDDFMKPDRIVAGIDNSRTGELLQQLYASFNHGGKDRLILMDIRSAELTKYAANAMLATKISFMNDMANLAEIIGADIEKVRLGIGSDSRIGPHFIYPGCGYGGSCFPKDVQAVIRTAQQVGYHLEILESVEKVNYRQKEVLYHKIKAHYQGHSLAGKTFALWGLAFKPNTDDMREASSRTIMEKLWAEGAMVRAYDPEAMQEAKRIYPDRKDLVLCSSQEEALQGADALIIVTEWKPFRTADLSVVKQHLRDQVVFDGRNLYDPALVTSQGLTYYSLGRAIGKPD